MKTVLNITNDISEVEKLGEWIRLLTEKLRLSEAKAFQINLAIEEAVVNVISYAYPKEEKRSITITASDIEDGVLFVIDDTGKPFNPTMVASPDTTLSAEERPIGGLGIMLYKEYASKVDYEYRDSHNILSLSFSIGKES